jgi:hypothetical protein
MPAVLAIGCALLLAAATVIAASAQQGFSGRISDSTCGASHQAAAAAKGLTDRQCLLACLKALSKYVLVDRDARILPIANQDAMGLPLYAGRPVKLTGDQQDTGIFVTKVEAIAAHLHLGHVMTNWRDTPGARGFLPVAIDEARVAIEHARLAAKSQGHADIALHVGHALHALDPTVEPRGPGAGYGLKRAATGALQHLDLASTAEGVTPNLTTGAVEVSSALSNALQSVDRAIAAAQSIRTVADATQATGLIGDFTTLTLRINEGLQQAQARMELILKAEGLLGAPR